jgi:mitochondrial Rho GTPase 1
MSSMAYVLSWCLQVSQDMGVEAPMPVSVKLGDTNNIFRQIVTAAEHPHLSIPKTEGRKTRKQYQRLIDQSLMFVSGILFFRLTC